MKIYRLQKRQILPIDLESAWAFFSNPANLERITPPDLSFRIMTELPEEGFRNHGNGLTSFRDLDTTEDYQQALKESQDPPII